MNFQLEQSKLPLPTYQLRFHPVRKWQFDIAWPDRWLALEVEGQGRHQTFMGFENDCVKYGEATLLGWTVLRASTRMVTDGRALELVKRALDVFPRKVIPPFATGGNA